MERAEDAFICVKRKWYRGHLKLVNDGDGLTVINEIPIEEYLKGVVPNEMPITFGLNALKAQTVLVVLIEVYNALDIQISSMSSICYANL